MQQNHHYAIAYPPTSWLHAPMHYDDVVLRPARVPKQLQRYHRDPDNADWHIERPSRHPVNQDIYRANRRVRPEFVVPPASPALAAPVSDPLWNLPVAPDLS